MITITLYNNNRLENNFVKGVVSTLFVLPGLLFFFSGNYILGFLFIILWISLETIKSGIEVDFKNDTIVFFKKYLGFTVYKNDIKIDKNKTNLYRIKKQSKTIGYSSRAQTSSVTRMYYTIEFSYNGKNIFQELLIGDNETIHQLAYDMEITWAFVKVTKK